MKRILITIKFKDSTEAFYIGYKKRMPIISATESRVFKRYLSNKEINRILNLDNIETITETAIKKNAKI